MYHPQVQVAGLAAGEPNLQPPGNWLLFASKTRSTNRFAGWTSFHRRSHRTVSVCCRAVAQHGGRVLGPALQEHLLLRYQAKLYANRNCIYSKQVPRLNKPVGMVDQFKQNSLQLLTRGRTSCSKTTVGNLGVLRTSWARSSETSYRRQGLIPTFHSF